MTRPEADPPREVDVGQSSAAESSVDASRAFTRMAMRNTAILVRTGYELHAAVLAGLEGSEVVAWVHGGRTAHPLIRLPGGERVIVRGYRRGGLMRHLNERRYFAGHRAFAEAIVTERARRAGVRVPSVIAAAEHRGRVGYTATLASLWIPDASDPIARLAAGGSDAEMLLQGIGAEIGKLHRAGIAHPDINLRNILVIGESAEVALVDFDRAKLFDGGTPPRARRRDLLRLGRSARKLGVPMGRQEWTALAEGYGTGWPLTDLLG